MVRIGSILLGFLLLVCMPGLSGQVVAQPSAECASSESRIMVPCDTRSMLAGSPEQEVFMELLGLLIQADRCANDLVSPSDISESSQSPASSYQGQGAELPAPIQLFVALPRDAQAASDSAEGFPPSVRSLADVSVQFFILASDPDRDRSADEDNRRWEIAVPRKAVQVNAEREQVSQKAAELVDFVYIPRLTRSEKDGWYYVAPVTAVPSRILDAPIGQRGQGVDLRRIRAFLEPTGIQFLELMHAHYANKLDGGQRAGSRAIRAAAPRLSIRKEDALDIPVRDEEADGLGKGLPYRNEELAYFALQLQGPGGAGGNPDEVGYLEAFYPILARFKHFWDEVEQRRVQLRGLRKEAFSNR